MFALPLLFVTVTATSAYASIAAVFIYIYICILIYTHIYTDMLLSVTVMLLRRDAPLSHGPSEEYNKVPPLDAGHVAWLDAAIRQTIHSGIQSA